MSFSISVVIRTKNESKYLHKVLGRLKEQQYSGDVEIIVVDSGSSDGTLEIANKFGCKVIEVRPEDFSFGRALNIGIENASGEIIVNLSGHSVPVNTDYFMLMVEPFCDTKVGATFGRDIPWPDACPSQARDILNHFPENYVLDGSMFSNANAALRKKCWELVKFNEELPATEDVLWAKQIMNLGYKIHNIPQSTVFHSHTPSLLYIHKRASVESRSINLISDIKKKFGISSFLGFFIYNIKRDWSFMFKKKYALKWFFHIPFYRFSQAIGLYKGYNTALKGELSNLTLPIYSFESCAKKNRKAILVTHCFFPESVGGTEYYTLNLAKKLVERNWEVKIVSCLRDLSQSRYKVIASKYDGIDVIKINNPQEFCTKFIDYFIDHTVDHIFRKILIAEKPDIVHFQHTAYLSSRLPEIAYQVNIPSVFTIHDYWYMCFRSQLIRHGEGVCPGPSDGLYCATCYDNLIPSPVNVPRLPFFYKVIEVSLIRKFAGVVKSSLPPQAKQLLKKILFKTQNISELKTENKIFKSPEMWNILEHTFRINFMRRQLSFPQVVISPSMHLKKRYEKEGFREIIYIPHGFEPVKKVDTLKYDKKLVLAYMSNILPPKGADIILRELKYVEKRENLKILFYGNILDYSYYKKLQDMAKEYSSQVEIVFMGPYNGKTDLEKIFTNVHLVVFPSLWEENHPLIVKEALIYGVPILCTSLGGAPDAIIDGFNGFVFDPYVEGSLAEKIHLIIDNPDILEKITQGARKTKIESNDEHIDKIIGIYSNVLDKAYISANRNI